jgi:hypothetical protein
MKKEIQAPKGIKNGEVFTSNGEQFLFLKECQSAKAKKRFEPWDGKTEPEFETVQPWDGKTEQ